MRNNPLRALRDRYLPALALCLLLSAGASAQNYYQQVNNNFAYRNVYMARALGLPTDTFALDAGEKLRPWVAAKGDTIYVWSPAANRWNQATATSQTLAQTLAIGSNAGGASATGFSSLGLKSGSWAGTMTAALTAGRNWLWPDKDGTVAMTADIPPVPVLPFASLDQIRNYG
ncbi:MAG: hypothetical protein EOP50_02915, partial [Sphingobacteriales bacterium]